MKYRVTHTTQYQYNEPISLCHNILHLRPRDFPGQVCLNFDLRVDPFTREMHERTDVFGNHFHFVSNDESHTTWIATARSVVDVNRERINPPTDLWKDVALAERSSSRLPCSLVEFTVASSHCPIDKRLADFARPSFEKHATLYDAVFDLMQKIHTSFVFDATATYVGISPIKVMEMGRGVCQDFSHLMISCLRSLGIPARYVSGHLRTVPPPGQERLIGADASHAWVAVFFPSVGWIDFDPTNAIIPANDHITVAWARDFEDVSPAKGVIVGNAWHTLSIAVDVEEITRA